MCLDGTGNDYGIHKTNVVRVAELAEYSDNQLLYYDPGVGTVNFFGESFKNLLMYYLGKAFGWGIRTNINEAYNFLMENYEEDDRIYLFGFSRGAYTARALAGMLYKCGLLRKGNQNLLPYVSNIYHTKDNMDIAREFKKGLCRECSVHFIGVWDTVEARGFLRKKKIFMNADLNPEVNFGYHALSIDEKRRTFKPFLWNEDAKTDEQVIEQVWFAGVHSNIGGWYDERGLSDITLKWMLEKAIEQGLIVKNNWKNSVNPKHDDIIHNSRTGLWKLWPTYDRIIPNGALIHSSVQERMQALPEYQPNLPLQYTFTS